MHFFLSKFLFIFSFMALSLSSGCKIDSGGNKATPEGEKPSLSFDAPKATEGDPKAASDSDKVKEKELRSAEEERKRFEDEASKLEKMVLVSMGQYLACAINTTNRLTCWAHPISSNPMSYYPKKTNAELMGLEFTSFATSQDKVCAVKKDGKVLCFIPNDPSKKTAAELAAMGSYQEVLLMDNGHVCLLNRSGSMSCHVTNFAGSTSQYVNQHISPSEIISFSLGGLKTGSTYTSGICYIASNNVVNCQKLALSPLSSPVSNLKASSLKFSPSFTREIAILSPNKKDLTFLAHQGKYSQQMLMDTSLINIIVM